MIGVIRSEKVATWDPVGKSRISGNLEHEYPIADFAISPVDAEVVVSVADKIRVWRNGTAVAELDHRSIQEDDICCPFTAVDFGIDSRIFGVTDIYGNCSLWDSKNFELIETYNLSDRILYDLCFVKSFRVFACVDETGSLFIMDRSTGQVTCAEGPEVMPACQPTKLAWLGTQALITFQISGIVLVYDIGGMKQAASRGPDLVGRVGGSASIAGTVWVEPDLFVVARDSGLVELWKIFSNKVQMVWSTWTEGVSAVGIVDGNKIRIGNADGQTSDIIVENEFLSKGKPIKQFEAPREEYPALA